MFTLNVKMAGAEGVQSLFYGEEATAHKAADRLMTAEDQHAPMWVTDERGHTFGIRPRDVISTMTVDLMKDIANQGEMALVQARENARLQSRAAADPALRTMNSIAQGGFMNGGRH